MIGGVASINEGVDFYKFSKSAMKEGFQLRKWCTNSKDLMVLIAEEGENEPSSMRDEESYAK